MVIALFALAFAMIVGGLFAAILGWDIVLVERGWTMVIAGSISATSGALLLGVAAIVSRLTRIQSELMRLQANLVEDEEAPVATTAIGAAAGMSAAALAGGLFDRATPETAPAEKEPALADVQAAGPAETAPSEPEAEAETEREIPALAPDESARTERFFEPRTYREASRDIFGEPPRAPEPAAPAREDVPAVQNEARDEPQERAEPEVRIPDFLLAGRFRETTYTEIRPLEEDRLFAPLPREEPRRDEPRQDEEPGIREREEDLFAPEPEPAPSVEPEAEREPEIETEAEPEPEPSPAAASGKASEAAGAPSVIGSYNSGDNRYVMYSDGSIEAETPQGMFRFRSLDELKEFIATGQGGTRLT